MFLRQLALYALYASINFKTPLFVWRRCLNLLLRVVENVQLFAEVVEYRDIERPFENRCYFYFLQTLNICSFSHCNLKFQFTTQHFASMILIQLEPKLSVSFSRVSEASSTLHELLPSKNFFNMLASFLSSFLNASANSVPRNFLVLLRCLYRLLELDQHTKPCRWVVGKQGGRRVGG